MEPRRARLDRRVIQARQWTEGFYRSWVTANARGDGHAMLVLAEQCSTFAHVRPWSISSLRPASAGRRAMGAPRLEEHLVGSSSTATRGPTRPRRRDRSSTARRCWRARVRARGRRLRQRDAAGGWRSAARAGGGGALTGLSSRNTRSRACLEIATREVETLMLPGATSSLRGPVRRVTWSTSRSSAARSCSSTSSASATIAATSASGSRPRRCASAGRERDVKVSVSASTCS